MQTMCLHLALDRLPHQHRITRFYRPDALPDAQPTESKHWRQKNYSILRSKHTHTHTHPFSGTTQVSRYQKGKPDLDFTEARDSQWQWHQLGHTQVCNSLQTDNHASTPPLSFFTSRMPFLPSNQQRQSIEGTNYSILRVQNILRSPEQRPNW